MLDKLVCFVKPYLFNVLVNAKVKIPDSFYLLVVINIHHKHKVVNDFTLIVFVGGVAFQKLGDKLLNVFCGKAVSAL